VEGGWLLRLDVGEKLPEAIARFCKDHGIPAATASGLGALSDVTLGYFEVPTKTYQRKNYPGSGELGSLCCNVAAWQGEPFAHTHVVLSGPDFTAHGGHLFDGTVSVTAEIRLWPIAKAIHRRSDPSLGLHVLDL
jgi:predicted DNA-binding protein with PD1-like motif